MHVTVKVSNLYKGMTHGNHVKVIKLTGRIPLITRKVSIMKPYRLAFLIRKQFVSLQKNYKYETTFILIFNSFLVFLSSPSFILG